MPEVHYSTTMTLAPEVIWDFVRDMNNWAPFLTGYQAHEVLSETDSVWTLKGDVGILSRIVRLKAHVTEWNGPERVSFTLVGINEEVEGGGTLVIAPESAASGASALAAPAPSRPGLFARLLSALFRMIHRLLHGGVTPALPAGGPGPASTLTFTLRMVAGGPTGPLVNAMLAPALMPAAEDLANKIAAHLIAAHHGGAPSAASR